VAALAAVAVPMYTSYVASSRENAAANAAGSVASFMGACINQGGNVGTGGTPIDRDGSAATTLTCAGTTVTPAPSIQLPIHIHLVISNPTGTGTVTATHTGGGNQQTYNY
jgi:Tfp pilus assembly protein PilE